MCLDICVYVPKIIWTLSNEWGNGMLKINIWLCDESDVLCYDIYGKFQVRQKNQNCVWTLDWVKICGPRWSQGIDDFDAYIGVHNLLMIIG